MLESMHSQHPADQFDKPHPNAACAHHPHPCSRGRVRPTPPSATQGLFLAPTIVGESLKGAFLLAEVFGGTFGLPTNPPPPTIHLPAALGGDDGDLDTLLGAGAAPGVGGVGGGSTSGGVESAPGVGGIGAASRSGGVGGRTDIVQALELGDRDRLVKFCEAVQLFSPVNAYVRPGEDTCCCLFPFDGFSFKS